MAYIKFNGGIEPLGAVRISKQGEPSAVMHYSLFSPGIPDTLFTGSAQECADYMRSIEKELERGEQLLDVDGVNEMLREWAEKAAQPAPPVDPLVAAIMAEIAAIRASLRTC